MPSLIHVYVFTGAFILRHWEYAATEEIRTGMGRLVVLPERFLSAGTHAINYQWGISVLFSLSLIHVFLEFPQNHKTFVGIGSHFRGALVRS